MGAAQLYEDTGAGSWNPKERKMIYPVVRLIRRSTWVWKLIRNAPTGFEEEEIWKDTHHSYSFSRDEILKMYPEMRKVT